MNKEFIKNWKLSFIYLYAIMIVCLIVRGVIMILKSEADNITISSILTSLSILTLGTAFITFLIAYFGFKNDETGNN
ncbi:hypothetical protein GCM10008107_04850 [Psychrosphaera saromensis]|uniref:Uncharacterized protein n=1 Tax=Psychrosphaera saromensis TaxID=716813 RepID=A0A2S7UXW2_9GAMM|nr:hypothetical protein BTO11_13600 [Psychrosphaera saromensis]GHB58819.1 hypothetical protein GCM10008107_04850 [Psychrosphaera saromensis]GLQ14206.1 hypothetical protein GCM10007917_16610 [Psychrosphaera saromensis]